MTRAIYVNVLMMLGLMDWIIQLIHPEKNAGNWLAAIAGAFVIRLVLPKLPILASLSGWFAATVFALLFSSTLAKRPFFHDWELFAVYGFVALVGDGLLQLIAFLIRLSQKVTGYALEHPGEAFDEGLERVEKVTSVWIRIKAPLLDILQHFSKKS